jgi:hypothetical protein
VNLGILIFLGFNFFVHGIKEMEFYIPVKDFDLGRILILNLVTGGFESCHCFSGNFEGR